MFKYLNDRLASGHYTAAVSRELIRWTDELDEIQSNLKNTELAFIINPYYKSILEKCSQFLQVSLGSPIPSDFKKIMLIMGEPIFIIENTITVASEKGIALYPMTLIGNGSYAKIFKYKDENYNKYFVIKRANKDLK